MKSSQSYYRADNVLVSFPNPQHRCGILCHSNDCIAIQRVKSSPEQGVPSTQVTKALSRLLPGMDFTLQA